MLPTVSDSGWPWLLAGILLLVCAGVVPSEERLARERTAVLDLHREVSNLREVSETYGRFLAEVGRGEPTVVRRLAAAQLGVLPRGHEPLVMLSGVADPPTRWIERAALDGSTEGPAVPVPVDDSSMLASLLQGPGQLWVFGTSLLLVFVGLLLGPTDRGAEPGSSATH
ncbi:MAG: hypothetical protein VXY94_07440 [Planctomycetota bacterium]|nr:hypothetical protein [Planctomycetota bacterium]